MIASEVIAGIDIGSNAARLIVKDIIPGKNYKNSMIKKTAYVRLPLRLGNDVFKYGYLREKKEAQFLKGMQIFKDLMAFYGVSDYKAVATSAVRSAENGSAVIEKIHKQTGIAVQMISGKQEAEILSRLLKNNLPDNQTFLSADLGGGSLDLSVFRDTEILRSKSFKIGTVRIINGLADEKEFDKMLKSLRKLKKEFGELQPVGSGGNINKISKMIGKNELKYSHINSLHKQLAPLNIKQRMLQYNLRYDRADVIVPAAEIYMKILKEIKTKTIIVPKVGIGDAVIYDFFNKRFSEK
jgi:exopolyphosphatase/guanosine-5'-triphosphate,3'-diphosphate pyrophosphatase